MREWTTAEARRRFREVLDAATDEPQLITRSGRAEQVVLISRVEFERLVNDSDDYADIVSFFRSSPLADPALDEMFDHLPEDRPKGALREFEW